MMKVMVMMVLRMMMMIVERGKGEAMLFFCQRFQVDQSSR